MPEDKNGPFNASVQVNRSLYFSPEYCTPERFASYAHQLRETLRLAPESVLETGVGSAVVSGFLRRAGIRVATVDIDPALGPDVAASVTALPFRDRAFDTVLCFEVLEHLPYPLFSSCLAELRRVCRGHALLSLPHAGRYYTLAAKLPKFQPRVLLDIPGVFPPEHVFDGEHYWEIGTRGYPLTRITSDISAAGFTLERSYRIFEHPYNMMFVLR